MTEEKLKKQIYDIMNGAISDIHAMGEETIPEIDWVQDEFVEGGFCSDEYQKVYDANRRICKRLGVDEDRDVEVIICGLSAITEHMCKVMYDYAVMFSKDTTTKRD